MQEAQQIKAPPQKTGHMVYLNCWASKTQPKLHALIVGCEIQCRLALTKEAQHPRPQKKKQKNHNTLKL